MGIVTNPILTITRPANGDPVSNAQIFIGNPDVDPTVPANRKQVQARQENGTLAPIAQPIRTNAGGNPQLNGSPVALEVAGNYSLTIQDSGGSQIYKQTSVVNAGDVLNTLYTDSGSANAMILTPVSGPLPTEYVPGQVVNFRPAATNTSTSVTIQFPGLDPVQTDFNVIGGLNPDTRVQFRYDGTTFRQEPIAPTNRGHDDGIVIAGSDGDSAVGRRVVFHFAPGQTGSSANIAMTSATEMNFEGLNPRTVSFGGVQAAELDQILSHGTANTAIVANTVLAGSVLRAARLYIPTAGGAVTAGAPAVALTGSWLMKAAAEAQSGLHGTVPAVKVA